jgi:hypothetical protein
MEKFQVLICTAAPDAFQAAWCMVEKRVQMIFQIASSAPVSVN